jgi:hypothetical protein
MKLRARLLFVFGLSLGLLATPGFAQTNIFETPGEITTQDYGVAIPPSTATNGRFFVGDIVLCEPGFTCPASLAGVDLAKGTNGAGVSDVLRYADFNGEAFIILYSDGYIQSQPTFPIYGPGDLASFIAAGFGRTTDLLGMGIDSGTTIPEIGPPTVHGGINIWSDTNESEVTPEPATLSLLGLGLAFVGSRLRRRPT